VWKSISDYKVFEVIWLKIVFCLDFKVVERIFCHFAHVCYFVLSNIWFASEPIECGSWVINKLFNKTMQKLSTKLSKGRLETTTFFISPNIHLWLGYMCRIYSFQEVIVFLNLPQGIKWTFSIECFLIRLLWIENWSSLQSCENVWDRSSNEAKLQQFPDIACLCCYQWLKKYYITLTCFISFRTFLLLSNDLAIENK